MVYKLRDFCNRLTTSLAFEYFIVALILANAVLLGVETLSQVMDDYARWIEFGHNATLGVFIVEAGLKLFARWPKPANYFRDGWNVFDFAIIVFSLIPATGSFAIIARMTRLLRLLRLVSAVPELRLIVATLVRPIPGMLHIVTLMSLMVYVYAIIGWQLFHEHDPEHWRNLGIALLSLFRVVTLEDWTDIMYKAMESHPLTWMYFVSFVVLWHLRRDQPVHRRGHQQPGRGQAGAPARPGAGTHRRLPALGDPRHPAVPATPGGTAETQGRGGR